MLMFVLISFGKSWKIRGVVGCFIVYLFFMCCLKLKILKNKVLMNKIFFFEIKIVFVVCGIVKIINYLIIGSVGGE